MVIKGTLPTWQQKILKQLDGRLAQYFVADDPDSLLAEESLQKTLLEQGLPLYFYEDSIELRHFLSVREIADSSDSCGCIISVDTDSHDIEALPYDLLSHARRLALPLGDCFPDLTYSVLKALQVEELNALDIALEDYTPGKMSESASCDFVLRHVFKLAPEIIQTSSDLLRSLLRLHYRDVELPYVLKRRLIALLARRKQFSHWPLEDIVSGKQSFFSFLQRHWPSYVEAVVKSLKDNIDEPAAIYRVSGNNEEKVVLPFGHDDVRVYIDTLFFEGCLTPIEVNCPDKLIGHWCLAGVLQDHDKELRKRLTGLIKLCEETLPVVEDRHQQWQQYAYRWAELSASFHSNQSQLKASDGVVDAYIELQQKIDDRFSNWMLDKYTGLHNHPPTSPAMLHHIPKVMAREVGSSKTAKTALILVDGLAINQWITARSELDFDVTITGRVTESAVFAWVPTVTSVSRQALFSAKAPYQFANTIGTTSSEPKVWQQFWQDHGLDKNQVYYKKGLGTGNVEPLIDELSDRRLRAVGLVINTVDDMMHGMQLGAAGMHNQVKLWAESGYLQRLIEALVDGGFSVHITSDHGNVEAVGSGKIKEGAVAESRGERARVYKTEVLMQSVDFSASDAVAWPRAGLPNDYFPVVMKGREAFVASGESIVGHGGIAIEEVIVPYIRVKRDSNGQ